MKSRHFRGGAVPALLFFVFFALVVPAAAALGGREAAPSAAPRASGPEAGTDDRREDRDRMVNEQIEARGIRNPRVLAAMRRVPRHLFVPASEAGNAYDDRPLPIGYGQTISQPYIVAYMTEALAVKEGEKVLEIGTGSGYQAAVLREMTPRVFSVEIIAELAERGRRNLAAAGCADVGLKTADGYYGWEDEAPFDAIIVTAAAGHIPPPLIRQLAKGGRIIMPVGGVYQVQVLVLLVRDETGGIRTEQLLPVRFVPMTGTAMEK